MPAKRKIYFLFKTGYKQSDQSDGLFGVKSTLIWSFIYNLEQQREMRILYNTYKKVLGIYTTHWYIKLRIMKIKILETESYTRNTENGFSN